jgi:hypothetical protein
MTSSYLDMLIYKNNRAAQMIFSMLSFPFIAINFILMISISIVSSCISEEIRPYSPVGQGRKEKVRAFLLLASVLIVHVLFSPASTLFSPASTIVCFILVMSMCGTICGSLNKHFALRITLWIFKALPWNLARFLTYCHERRLLQQIGGRYRFIHRELLDHFAKMEN